MAKARQKSEQWAATDYAQALAKGDALTPEERQKTIDEMSRYTGLSKDVIDQANLRIDVGKFTHYLLLDQKLRVGGLDGRFTDSIPMACWTRGISIRLEPSIVPPYTSVFNNYVRTSWATKPTCHTASFPMTRVSRRTGIGARPRTGYPDTATALRKALVKNPYLKVQVLEGYYDLATPYFAANYTMDHLDLGAQIRKNFSFATYEAGHMVYLPVDGLKKMKTDTGKFVEESRLAGN